MHILPDIQLRGEIDFHLCKNLSYKTRWYLILICLIGGFLVQLYINFYLGLPFIVIGTFLSLVIGYSASSPPIDREKRWERVTPDEYRKIMTKDRLAAEWDQDAFDITNLRGFGIFILSALAFGGMTFYLFSKGYSNLAIYFGVDCAIILIPHWLTGIRQLLKQSGLITKIEILANILNMLSEDRFNFVLAQPMLEITKTQDGEIPSDARLLLKLSDMPDNFLGVQVQISINDVQGKEYPYLYCVLIARSGFKLKEKFERFTPYIRQKLKEFEHPNIKTRVFRFVGIISQEDGFTLEFKKAEGDIDVLVIRQFTTERSGYYTNKLVQEDITEFSLDIAKKLIRK